MDSPVIDIHTHMLTQRWLDMVGEQGGDSLQYKVNPSTGKMCIYKDGAPFMTPNAGMMDYALRIRKMDEAKVDVAVVSLTCPNVYFGDGATSLAAAQNVNDDLAAAQTAYVGRRRLEHVDQQFSGSARPVVDDHGLRIAATEFAGHAAAEDVTDTAGRVAEQQTQHLLLILGMSAQRMRRKAGGRRGAQCCLHEVPARKLFHGTSGLLSPLIDMLLRAYVTVSAVSGHGEEGEAEYRQRPLPLTKNEATGAEA